MQDKFDIGRLTGVLTIMRSIMVCGMVLALSSQLFAAHDKPISEGEAQDCYNEWEGASSSLCSNGHTMSLSCISQQNISISSSGQSEITPGMMLSGNVGDPSDYEVEIIDPPMYTNVVTCDMVGQTISVRVKEKSNPSNSCWGYVTVEDKLPPVVPCHPKTVPCNTDIYAKNADLFLPGTWDNCTDEDDLNIWFSQTIHDLHCDPNFVGYIDRTWHVSDEYGNETVCQQRINLGRLSLPLVEFPEDITLDCENPNTDTAYTGQPTVNGEPISAFCELVIDYTDQTTPLCGNTYAISRNWSIVDWCTGNSITDVQLITVRDEKAPEINCPSSTTINAGNGDCTATYFVPSFPVDDNCTPSNKLNVQVEIDGYDVDAQMPVSLDLGDHLVEITATDQCGNSSSCSYTVTVKDLLPPILDCHDVTVEIGETGENQVFYADQLIGDIVVDNCGVEELLIKRVQSYCSDHSDLYFGPSIELCCDDVGTAVHTKLKVIDDEGNSSVCDFDLIVVDNTAPQLTCPEDVTLECGTDISDLSEFGSPEVVENCNYSLEETVDSSVNVCGEGVITRSFTATDENGNSASCSQVIELVNDNPFGEEDITWPDDVTLTSCDPVIDPTNTGEPHVDIGECAQIGITYSDDSGPTGEACLIINRHWTVMDTCTDQSFDYSQEILIKNNASPELTVPNDYIAENATGSCAAFVDLNPATVSDCNTGVQISNNYNNQAGDIQDSFPVGITEVIFTAVDECGNSSTAAVTVEIEDTELPGIICPGDITVANDSGACSALVTVPYPTVSDNCGIDSVTNSFTNTDTATTVYPVGTTEVTYVVYDSSGNSATCTFSVTVTDMETPVLTCPGDITVSTDSASCTANVDIPLPTYSDNCTIDTIYNSYTDEIDASGVYEVGTTEVTYTVVDSSGMSTSCSFTVTVEDNEDPQITCPEDIELSAMQDSCSAMVDIPVPDVTDNCQLDSIVNDYTGTEDASGNYPVGSTDVTYTVIDEHGNSATCTLTVTVTDDQSPSISCPSDITVSNDPDSCNAFVSIDVPTSSDNCAVDSVNNDYTGTEDASGIYPVGTTTVTYTVEDEHGNSSECSFTVTVEDNEHPEITCPSDVTVSSDSSSCGATVDFDIPLTEDNCSIDSIVNDFTGTADASGFYNVGTTQVTYTVYDASGNSTECSFSVTVEDDLSPFISCPDDITVASDSGSCVAFVDIPLPTVSDNCELDTFMNDFNNSTNASDTFPAGTTTVTYTAVDTSGNSASCSFTVTVQDQVFPMISCPSDITVSSDSGACSAIVTISPPTASDNCGVDSLYNDYNGTANASDTFPVGITDIVYTVVDSSGNSVSCTFTVTVQDTVSPTIVCPDDLTVGVDSTSCSAVVDIPSPVLIGDNCGIDSLFHDYNEGNSTDTFPVGTTSVVYTAVDSSGNSATCSVTITVEDNIDPVISCPDDLTVSNDSGMCAAVVTIPPPQNSSDNCGIDSLYHDYGGGQQMTDTFPVGTTTITYTAVDSFGNTATCSFTITVEDVENPSITCPQDIQVNTGTDSCSAFVQIPVPSTSDNCQVDSLTNQFTDSTDASGVYPLGSTTVIYTVYDNNGNTTTCSFSVTVSDDQAPSITCPDDLTVAPDPDSCSAFVSISLPSVDDNCAVDSFSNDYTGGEDASGVYFTGTTTVTYTIYDESGNSSTCSFTVTVIDDEHPTISCPADITVFSDSASCNTFVDVPLPTTNDNCGVDSVTNTMNDGSDASDTYPVGNNPVTFTVFDNNGNSASCTFTVTVLDTISPVISCPSDLTVSSDSGACNAVVDIGLPVVSDNCGVDSFSNDYNNTENASDTFPVGTTTVVYTAVDSSGNSTTCQFTVTVEDGSPPEFTNCPSDITISCDSSYTDLSIFGDAVAMDNCSIDILSEDSTFALDDCGIGLITRTWIASDPSGNSDTCMQEITVTGGSNGFVDSLDIIWPEDTLTVVNCTGITPDSLNSFPFVDPEAGNCHNLSYTYMDSTVMSGLGCFTVLREFNVVDSCQINDSTDQGMWTYEQLIVVDDSIPPTVSAPDSIDVLLPPGQCDSAFVNVSASAFDDCTGVSITNNSPYADSSGADASGYYPMCDPVVVTFTAMDSCGNTSTDSTIIHVRDTVPPVFSCEKAEYYFQDDLEAEVHADSFVTSVMDNCTDSMDLFYSFSPDPADSIQIFDCDTDPNVRPITVYVIDECGNYDTCMTLLGLKDRFDVCPDSLLSVEGQINDMEHQPMQGVSMYLSNPGGNDQTGQTDNSGSYRFEHIPEGSDVHIQPHYDKFPLNGVTTYDIVLITKHILGVREFDQPDQLIAADVNRSGTISAADLVEIRKLILGLIQTYSNNTSWRFVAADANMGNPLQDAPDYMKITDMQHDRIDINFNAIKVGDVNYSANAAGQVNIEDRQPENWTGNVAIQHVQGNTYHLTFRTPEQLQLEGFQESFRYDPSMIQSIAFNKDIERDLTWHSGQWHVTDNAIRMSWNTDNSVELQSGDVLFALSIRGKSKDQIKQAIQWGDEYVPGELYTSDTRPVRTLNWRWNEAVGQETFVLHQNIPNPFRNQTVIPVQLPEREEVNVRIYSAEGRLLYEDKQVLRAGLNELTINLTDLHVDGVLYYEVQTSRHRAIKKMVKMRK